MFRNPDLPAPEDLVHGRVYKIHSRNLAYGIWNKNSGGFIGIREKFGDRFPFTEYHYDVSKYHGTVGMATDIGIDAPEQLKLQEYLRPSIDQRTKRPVEWKETNPEKGTGEWFFLDTGEFDNNIRPTAVLNKELFEFLEKVENERRQDNVE